MISKNCLFCKKLFYAYPSRKQKFCSAECQHKGQFIHNRGLKGYRNNGTYQNGHKGFKAEENPQWKGIEAGMVAKHAFISRYKGKPNKCEFCGTEEKRRYEWANVSGEYKRDLDDFVRLCVPCHRQYDGNMYKAWITRRAYK